MVDFRAGRVVLSTNLPLRDVPLRDLLSERYGVPVVLDNDANVACLAEFRYGAGIGTSEMIMLTLGTGIGGGIVTNGRLYRGASGAAGELGHMLIDYDGPPCQGACPNRGCLEVYASGQAMGQAAADVARAQPDSALGRALAAGEEVDGPLLSSVALAGDPAAVAALTDIGEKLGLGIVSIVNIFNPELVVVGGGRPRPPRSSSRRPGAWWPSAPCARSATRCASCRPSTGSTPVCWGRRPSRSSSCFPTRPRPAAAAGRALAAARRRSCGLPGSLPCTRAAGILATDDPSWATAGPASPDRR